MAVADRLVRGVGVCRGGAALLARRPLRTVAVFAAVQVAASLAFAFGTRHNGAIWYQGGDQLWYVTGGWLLGHFQQPPALVGWGWSFLLAPLTWITGPTWPGLAPLVIVLELAILAPLCVFCVYGIGARLGGRALGLWAAFLWVAVPFVSIPLFVERYHERFVDQFLPQGLGFSAMADYPSMAALLAAALFVCRSIAARSARDAVLAGLLVGLAGGMKPPNYLFLVGVGAAYLAMRRVREPAWLVAGLVPGLLTLVLWKARGLGNVPLFAYEEARVAMSHSSAFVAFSTHQYLNIDWGQWRQNMSDLREYFFSARLLEWLPIAGAIGAVRIRAWGAALLAGWLGAFLLVKGTSRLASVEVNTFFRLLMPAWPAYLVLGACTIALVPTLTRRLGPLAEPTPVTPVGRRPVAGAAMLVGLLPLVWIGVSSSLRGEDRAVIVNAGTSELLTPVDRGIHVTTERRGESVVLTWTHPGYRARVFYRVLRTPGAEADAQCTRDGVDWCRLQMLTLGTTREARFVDGSPPAGVTWRIGVATNYADDPNGGDVFAVSPPIRAGD